MVANGDLKTVAWFKDNPLFSMSKYQVREDPLGSVSLVKAILMEATGDGSIKSPPAPFILKIVTVARTQLLAFESAAVLAEWRAFIATVITDARPALGGGMLATASTSVSVETESEVVEAACIIEPYCGGLLKAAPGWRTFQKRYVWLDTEHLCLKYYDQGPSAVHLAKVLGGAFPEGLREDDEAAMKLVALAGMPVSVAMRDLRGEKGTIRLKGATVSLNAWGSEDGAGMLATSPTFSVSSEQGRVFAFVARHNSEKLEWASRVEAAICWANRIFERGSAILPPPRPGMDGASRSERLSRAGMKRMTMVAPTTVSTEEGVGTGPREAAAALLSARHDRIMGYIHKIGSTGSWTFRYMVLRGSVLSYYTDHNRRELKGSITLGLSALTGSGFPGKPPATKAPTDYKFHVVSASESAEDKVEASAARTLHTGVPVTMAARTYLFCAEDGDAAAKWVAAIAAVVEAHATVKNAKAS